MLKKTKKNLAVQGIFYKLPRESPPKQGGGVVLRAHQPRTGEKARAIKIAGICTICAQS